MDCKDLFQYRKGLCLATAVSVGYIFITVFAIISPWWHQETQVTITVLGEETKSPLVERVASLVDYKECRPASEGEPTLCFTGSLAGQIPGDATDAGLFKAGAVGFTFIFIGLLIAGLAAVLTASALLGQSDKLRPEVLRSKKALILSHVMYSVCNLISFACYAGVVNAEVPDADVTSLRFGFGFGLCIISWLVGAVMAVFVWKVADMLPASEFGFEEGSDDEEEMVNPAKGKAAASGSAGASASGDRDARSPNMMLKNPLPTRSDRQSRGNRRSAPPPPSGKRVSSGLPKPWKVAIDPESGDAYYFNPQTGATTWDKPTA